MSESTIANVSDTALWVAYYRAQESERPDALFRDPLAGVLAGDRGRQIAENFGDAWYVSWSMAIRTWIIDNYIQECLAEGVDTIVNLGAGLDTRPYRLELPASLHWIEVDYPAIIDLKEDRLKNEKPRCRLERVRLDLSDHPARKKLFSEISARAGKVFVLTEGVIPYLSNNDVSALAEDMRAHKNFYFWVVDYFAYQAIRYFRNRRRKKLLKNAPIRFMPQDWFGFFRQHGWEARHTRYLSEESERLGRRVPIPWWFRMLRALMPRKRREAFKKFSAYVLLTPIR